VRFFAQTDKQRLFPKVMDSHYFVRILRFLAEIWTAGARGSTVIRARRRQ
jgi:hypothetical protein